MMKTLRNTQCLAVVLCSVATFWSCSDELEHGGTGFSSDAIVFDGSLSEEWNTPSGTRSAAGKDSVMNRTQKFENAELYLHTTVTPGIEVDSSFAVTRASEITNASITDYSFGVYAYAMRKESEDDTFDPSKAAEYIVDQEVSHNGSKWTCSPARFWPASNNYLMQFIGYAPYGTVTILAENNTPTIDYTVPEAAADQKDLLVCSTDQESANRTPVPMNFDHICTAVKFVVGDIDGTIHSIALKGVRNKGTFDMTQDRTDENNNVVWKWDLDETETATGDFTLTFNDADGQLGDAGTDITSGETTFMMLPQTLPESAQIEVVYTDDDFGIKRTLTADIGGSTWPIDQTMKYKISASAIDAVRVFDVGVAADDTGERVLLFTNTHRSSDTYTYQVKSHIEYNSNDPDWDPDRDWWVAYDSDNDDAYDDQRPSWLTFTKKSKSYDIKVSARDALEGEEFSEPYNVWLRSEARGYLGSATEPYNLSTNSTDNTHVGNTANCYVINGPGYYSLPLVYGNAIKNGSDNTPAYKPDMPENNSNISSANFLTPFYNHSGAGITSPWIEENNETDGMTAGLIWQDAPNLIPTDNIVLEEREITYNNTTQSVKFLKFEIPRETICEGNAVLAVKDATGNVLWSWHIWVTDWTEEGRYDGSAGLIPVQRPSNTYTMMSVNLGWCNGELHKYAHREVKIRFTQENNPDPIYITVRQDERTVSHGNSLFYQWGRKDPMISVLPNTNDKPYYTSDGIRHTTMGYGSWNEGITTIKNGILHPQTFAANQNMDNMYINLWGAESTTQTQNTVKTIYDPCPVGYKVPVSDMFRAFTTTGGNTENGGKMRGKWDPGAYGWYLHDGNGHEVFFPWTGFRNYGSAHGAYSDYDGKYWSAIPYEYTSPHTVYSMSIGKIHLNPQGHGVYFRGSGLSIAPIKEW